MEPLALPTLNFDVEISTKSIIYLALAIIIASLIVMVIARQTKAS
jgi:hypothetical protein